MLHAVFETNLLKKIFIVYLKFKYLSGAMIWMCPPKFMGWKLNPPIKMYLEVGPLGGN
jgi:hypothetical protein